MRTRESIEAQTTDKTASKSPHDAKARTGKYRGLVAPWKPGQSGNPGGRPKSDVAQFIARKVFEQNEELIYKAFAASLAKGGAFAFQVLSDRAYGKLKEVRDTGSEFNEVPDADLQSRLDAILRDLGLTQQIDACGRSESDPKGTAKANGAAKDHDLLPR